MKFNKIGVIGAGTMGRGIAIMLASKGLDVYLTEITKDRLDKSMKLIHISLDKQMEKWAITAAEKKLILSKIHKGTLLTHVQDCQLIIETITEEFEMKRQVLQDLDELCPPEVIIASNTSTLSLTELASFSNLPERMIVLHFLHPVSTIDVVEIVRGLKTADTTFMQTKYFVEEILQKKGVTVYESPGYVTTRLVNVLINEAVHTLSEGVATAEDIDSAMRMGYGFHHGPLEMADRFGLDAVLIAMERLFREFGEMKYRPSFILKKMVRGGHLGVKSGEGFFRYDLDGDRI